MVGLGHLGSESALARVSLVNYHGHILLDTFVAPRERVTDYRTWISGVREGDLIGAPPFQEIQAKVAALLEDRVVVGHAIENDLKVCSLFPLLIPLSTWSSTGQRDSSHRIKLGEGHYPREEPS